MERTKIIIGTNSKKRQRDNDSWVFGHYVKVYSIANEILAIEQVEYKFLDSNFSVNPVRLTKAAKWRRMSYNHWRSAAITLDRAEKQLRDFSDNTQVVNRLWTCISENFNKSIGDLTTKRFTMLLEIRWPVSQMMKLNRNHFGNLFYFLVLYILPVISINKGFLCGELLLW